MPQWDCRSAIFTITDICLYFAICTFNQLQYLTQSTNLTEQVSLVVEQYFTRRIYTFTQVLWGRGGTLSTTEFQQYANSRAEGNKKCPQKPITFSPPVTTSSPWGLQTLRNVVVLLLCYWREGRGGEGKGRLLPRRDPANKALTSGRCPLPSLLGPDMGFSLVNSSSLWPD